MAGLAVTPGAGAFIAMDKVGSATAPTTDDRLQYVKMDRGAAGSSDPVTAINPLPTGRCSNIISVTLSLDTSAYASGDLLADAQVVTSAARSSGGGAKLISMTVVDEDDQGVAFDVYLTSSSNSWGTENSAPSISDTDARSIQAKVSVATADYKDLGGVRIAHYANINSLCLTVGSANLYVAVVNGTGTPTFTASGVKLIFGFEQN
jgi:hypothetical protein